jgi:hypothetical protein
MSGAAGIAAAAQRRRRNEEEAMAGSYRADDIEGWEFKILRSATRRAFGSAPALRAVLDEEARAGWELVEKFDDHRVRLKRRVDQRDLDRGLPFDPYRTWVGTHPSTIGLYALLGTLVFIGAMSSAAAIFG